MMRYNFFFEHAGAIAVVTDRPLNFLDSPSPKWIRAKEYHHDVSKYYWNADLKDVYICLKKVAYIEFDGYIEPPKKEARE